MVLRPPAAAASRCREAWRVAFVALVAVAALYPYPRRPREDRRPVRPLRRSDARRQRVHGEGDLQRQGRRPCVSRTTATAIRWMLENVEGSPVVAEINTAPTLYGWESRYAMFTGNPAHRRMGLPPASAASAAWRRRCRSGWPTSSACTGRRPAAVAYDILTSVRSELCRRWPARARLLPGGRGEVGAAARGGTGRSRTANPGVRIYRVLSRASAEATSASDDPANS